MPTIWYLRLKLSGHKITPDWQGADVSKLSKEGKACIQGLDKNPDAELEILLTNDNADSIPNLYQLETRCNNILKKTAPTATPAAKIEVKKEYQEFKVKIAVSKKVPVKAASTAPEEQEKKSLEPRPESEKVTPKKRSSEGDAQDQGPEKKIARVSPATKAYKSARQELFDMLKSLGVIQKRARLDDFTDQELRLRMERAIRELENGMERVEVTACEALQDNA